MPRFLVIAVSAAAVAPAGLSSPSTPGSAPTLRTRPCPRYITGAPARYVRLAGTGFTPGSAVMVAYRGPGRRADADRFRADARGAVTGRASGPDPGALRRFVTHVSLTATDTARPAHTAATRFFVVRLAARLPRITRPHAIVTFRLYGFPDASVVWAHYFFAGRPVVTTRMGRTKGVCGLVRRRGRYLPAPVRYGRWQLYLSTDRRFTPVDARHRRYVLAGSFRVLDRRYFARPRAAAGPGAIRWSPGAA